MTNVDPKHIRDIQADRKAAMIEEYANYVRGGYADAADEVAAELKLTYGHDVGGKQKADKPAEPPVERAVPSDPEVETPEAPVKRGPGRPRKATE